MIYQINLESETADADYHDDDSQNHLEEKHTPPPKLQQSIDEVFDKYAQKVDQSYGQIIKDNKILKVLVYPSMVFLHTIMVKLKNNVCLTITCMISSGSFLISSRA